MLTLSRGTITAVIERHDGLVRLEVDGAPCVAYPPLTGPVALGDDVLVNTQARELGLGTGGFDVLHANLTRGLGLPVEAGAHVMKLPYTSLQAAFRHVEEDEEQRASLDGTPVVCCSLHSQLAPVCAALDDVSIAYVQLPGGALPVALSDTVRALRERFRLTTLSVGPCFGGDREAVTAASALLSARADVVVCGIGPGIAGTGTRFGHGGLAAADAANAASALGGRPVIAVRVSEADERDRHRGVSHHTQAVLDLCSGDVTVAWPDDADTSGWEEACAGLPLSHMGRGPAEDPSFFRAAFAAGVVARELVG